MELLDGLDERMAKVFGEDDVNVVNVRLWRAAALLALGRPGDASSLMESGLAWRRRQFGDAHAKTKAAEALQRAITSAMGRP